MPTWLSSIFLFLWDQSLVEKSAVPTAHVMSAFVETSSLTSFGITSESSRQMRGRTI